MTLHALLETFGFLSLLLLLAFPLGEALARVLGESRGPTWLERQLYRLADLSEIILGVMNTNISCLFEVLLELLNRLPKMGMSPKNGTLV